MWMKSEFANWEVEGMVRERIDDALGKAQQQRLRGTAGRTVTRGDLSSFLNALKITERISRVRYVWQPGEST
jgi:hypothetical protein